MEVGVRQIDFEDLVSIVQSILFASPLSVSKEELMDILENKCFLSTENIDIDKIIYRIKELLSKSKEFGFELSEDSNGYFFETKKANYLYVSKYIEQLQNKKLSKSSLETLSIIAFQQDCTKSDIENIRGVSCDYSIEKLLDKELIEISGKRNTSGSPSTFTISSKFLDYFGLKSLNELPKMEELKNYISSKEQINI